MNSTLFIGVVGVVLLVALAVARDQDMRPRSLKWHEYAGMALLGAMAASTYDLMYVAPPIAFAFIAARVVAAGLSASSAVRLAALKRWGALSVGFLVVFVPVRIEIAGRCKSIQCYGSSELNFSVEVLELVAMRMLSGTPPAGWLLVDDLGQKYGVGFGIVAMAANAFLSLLMLGIAVYAVGSAVALATRIGAVAHSSAKDVKEAEEAGQYAYDSNNPHGALRLAAALTLFGVVTAALASLVVSLSKWIQSSRIDYGWRDTLLTQMGWSFVITAAIVAVIGALRNRRAQCAAGVIAVAVLGAALTLTLLSNAHLTQIDRREPVSSMTNLISASTINLDTTDTGNTYRCALIDSYVEVQEQFGQWYEHGLRVDLDKLMINRYGLPFCERDH